jgi:transposase
MRRNTRRNEIRGPGGALPIRAGDEATADLVMLIEGETSGRDLDQVLSEFGRSRSTYYEKLRRYREQGLEGLLARPPGPRSAWRRPIEVVRFIVTTKLRHPERTPATIATELESLGHTVSVRSVERTLAQFGLTRPRISQGGRSAGADAEGAMSKESETATSLSTPTATPTPTATATPTPTPTPIADPAATAAILAATLTAPAAAARAES